MRSVRLAVLIAALAAGSGLAGAVQIGPRDGAGLPPHDLDRVKVGEPAPDFTLPDMHGEPVTLSSFRGKAFTLLVFYRGHW